MNYYAIVITDKTTHIGYPRWSITKSKQSAENRARIDGMDMAYYARQRGEFVFDIKVVSAKSRKEVVKNWAV